MRVDSLYCSWYKFCFVLSSMHTVTAGPMKAAPASLSRNSLPVVTGRSNHPPQYLAVPEPVPDKDSGSPSQNCDDTISTDAYSLQLKVTIVW